MTVDEKYMRMALAQAQEAAGEDEVPVGAVLVHFRSFPSETAESSLYDGGEVVARAHNMTECLNDPTAHAEMLCVTSATSALGGKYLNECCLYVTVEPCPMCAGALAWAQVGRVVYGAGDPKRGFSMFSPSLLHPKTKVVKGVLEAECSELVSAFFKSKRQ